MSDKWWPKLAPGAYVDLVVVNWQHGTAGYRRWFEQPSPEVDATPVHGPLTYLAFVQLRTVYFDLPCWAE